MPREYPPSANSDNNEELQDIEKSILDARKFSSPFSGYISNISQLLKFKTPTKFIQLFLLGSGVQPAMFQSFHPPLNRMWTMWTTSLFFGSLRTVATLSTWIVWPRLDALTCSIHITSITQVFISPPYAITVMLTFEIQNLSCHTNPKAKTTQPKIWPPPNLAIWRCWKDENLALPSRRMWPSPVRCIHPRWLVLQCGRYDHWWSLN